MTAKGKTDYIWRQVDDAVSGEHSFGQIDDERHSRCSLVLLPLHCLEGRLQGARRKKGPGLGQLLDKTPASLGVEDAETLTFRRQGYESVEVVKTSRRAPNIRSCDDDLVVVRAGMQIR